MNWFVTKEKRSHILQKDENFWRNFEAGVCVYKLTLQQM